MALRQGWLVPMRAISWFPRHGRDGSLAGIYEADFYEPTFDILYNWCRFSSMGGATAEDYQGPIRDVLFQLACHDFSRFDPHCEVLRRLQRHDEPLTVFPECQDRFGFIFVGGFIRQIIECHDSRPMQRLYPVPDEEAACPGW